MEKKINKLNYFGHFVQSLNFFDFAFICQKDRNPEMSRCVFDFIRFSDQIVFRSFSNFNSGQGVSDL